jgi:hypothetical protein
MNPNLCRIVLRPRNPFEVFDLSLRLVRERYRPFLRLGACLVLPLWVFFSALAWWLDGVWWVALLPLVVGPLVQAPFTMLTGRLLFSDEVSTWQVLGDTAKQGGALCVAWLVEVAALVIGALSCGLGVLPLQGAVLYVTEAALLERVGAQRGVRRTLRLAFAHGGIAAAGAVARWWFLVWFAVTAEAVGQGLVSGVLQLGTPFGDVLLGEVTPFLILGILLSHPVYAIYRLLLYVDVRTRVEGWDLQVGLRAAGLSR